MTSALDSHFGLALQTSKGVTATADASFDYVFFTGGPGIGPQPVILPLDQEIGSGSLIRDVKKVAVSTAGAIEFIPRPSTIGWFLKGALGMCSTATASGFNTHTFKFDSVNGEFYVPYFTMRRRNAVLGGDIAPDVRIAQLQFTFTAANYLRATAAYIGSALPQYVETPAWSPETYLDETPPFLTCKGVVELPDGTQLKVLSGTVTIGNVMPLDEQFIVGSYTPDDLEIVSRAIVFDLIVKGDADLYEKGVYDPAQGGAWIPDILKEADVDIKFQTVEIVDGVQPYEISFHANAENQASGVANIAWAVIPAPLRGNRQVTMRMTGAVLADTEAYTDGPFSVKLINEATTY